jgi:hypothetical protein
MKAPLIHGNLRMCLFPEEGAPINLMIEPEGEVKDRPTLQRIGTIDRLAHCVGQIAIVMKLCGDIGLHRGGNNQDSAKYEPPTHRFLSSSQRTILTQFRRNTYRDRSGVLKSATLWGIFG